MKNLFFVRRKDEVCFVYCPIKPGVWRGEWMPLSLREKTEVVLEYVATGDTLLPSHSSSDIGAKRRSGSKKNATQPWEGPSGWVLRDCSPGLSKGGTKSSILLVPSVEPDDQDSTHPPMCQWSLPGADFKFDDSKTPEDTVHTLMERASFREDLLQPVAPYTFELPFAKINYFEKDMFLARLDVFPCKVAIDDKTSEELLSFLMKVTLNIAQRPGMRLHIVMDAENAAVPAMKHVKRLLSWSNGEGAELLALTVRGFVTVLKPKGLTGMALNQVLAFVQKVAPALWPEKVAPTAQDADSFLSSLPIPPSATCDEKFATTSLPPLPEGQSVEGRTTNAEEIIGDGSSPVAQRDASPGGNLTFEPADKADVIPHDPSGHSVDLQIVDHAHDVNKEKCAACGAQCTIS